MNKFKVYIVTLLICCSISCFSQDTLRVATWNTFLLPKFIQKTNQKSRAKEIATCLLNQELDVICLQEVFYKKAKRIIIDSLKKIYPYYIVGNQGRFLKTSSGLITFSKYPISSSKFVEYKNKRGVEKFATKGVLKTDIRVGRDSISFYNTHMQSSDNKKSKLIRKRQLVQIKSIFSNNLNRVFMGDFNIRKQDALSYHNMLSVLKASDVNTISAVKVTCHTVTNELNKNKDITKEYVLDYILLAQDASEIKVQDKQVIEVRGKDKQSLSDHSLVKAKIIVE